MIEATEALERLKAGNRRFVKGKQSGDASTYPLQRESLVDEQKPFAVVLGCSDSRVPVELVFDQALGDLFVIRIAGNIAEPTQLGSIEYAVQNLGVRLVVVLGHSQCGAVQATLDLLEHPGTPISPNLHAVVKPILAVLGKLSQGWGGADRQTKLDQAIPANVLATVQSLPARSAVLRECIDAQGLQIVGGVYSLATGVVDFL